MAFFRMAVGAPSILPVIWYVPLLLIACTGIPSSSEPMKLELLSKSTTTVSESVIFMSDILTASRLAMS